VLPGKTFSVKDIVAIVVRRRWLLLLPLAIGFACIPVIAKRIPPVYRSETLIMVIPQRVPDAYVKSTVTATMADRLPSISDQIMSRSRLERIINDFGLYTDLRAHAPMEDVIKRMQGDIGPVQITVGAQSFRVSYSSEDPVISQKVTQRLASLFIDENNRDRENLAESTNVFLETELETAKRQLLEHERKLELYKRTHTGELPQQLEGNLRTIDSAQMQLRAVTESNTRAQEQRMFYERQLADAQATPDVAPVVVGNNPEPQQLTVAQQLELAQRNLEALKAKYTPDHPDVRRAERGLSELKQRLAIEASRPTTPSAPVVSLAEQARLKRIRELQAQLDVINHQTAAYQAEEGRLKAVIADFQRKVAVVPTRESELVELTRDYNTLKQQYDSLLSKREDSKLAANLERRQIGEQFRILDAAPLPSRPANELKRIGLSLSGVAFGLVVGLALVGFLVYRDSSFAKEEEIERLLELPVLATVPTVETAAEQKRQRRLHRTYDGFGITVLASSVLFVVWDLFVG
jgi:polysaccharide chain length determinant protein (PEP-CTERM system associated)